MEMSEVLSRRTNEEKVTKSFDWSEGRKRISDCLQLGDEFNYRRGKMDEAICEFPKQRFTNFSSFLSLETDSSLVLLHPRR